MRKLFLLLALTASQANASEQVFQFKNPSFGGGPGASAQWITTENEQHARQQAIQDKIDAASEKAHELFLNAYRLGAWKRAYAMAVSMRGIWSGHLAAYYDMMAERIKDIQANPPRPKEWDGIYRAQTK